MLQETFLVVTQEAEAFELGTNFFAWARRIATFKVLALARDRQRGPVRLADDVVEALVAAAPTEDDGEQHLAELGHLRQCLEKLAPAARELIRLRYFGEHLPEQIAHLRSQSVNAVNVTLSRARATLRKCLERRLELGHES